MPLASLLFIFLFLPSVFLLFYILTSGAWRNGLLVMASLVFFGWSDPGHLPLLILAVLVDYFLGIVIGKKIEKVGRSAARPYMWLAAGINLLMLVFYKYTGFLLGGLADVINVTIEFQQPALPLGISFFTFSGISYILDVYNSTEVAEKNFLRFAAYLVMFPKLLQGPITRIGQVKNELMNSRLLPDGMMEGARRFIGGLAKKVLLADSLAVVTDRIFAMDLGSLGVNLAWFGLLSYTAQIYLDFSGYTDMAVGLGKMLGLKLPENFNFPYISRSVTDFWRRWHMTLTAWFRTYLFIPLEFARKREKILRQQTNLLIVFLLTGLWHGASWNFILWGIYFGLILAVEASGFGKLLKKLPAIVQYVYAAALIILGWVFFRITSIQDWGPFLGALFGSNGWGAINAFRSQDLLYYIPLLVIGIVFCLPVFHTLEKRMTQRAQLFRAGFDIAYLCLFVLSVASILAKGFIPFLYAQF